MSYQALVKILVLKLQEIWHEKSFPCITELSVISVVLIGWSVLKYNDELRSDGLENVYVLFQCIDLIIAIKMEINKEFFMLL